MLKASRFANSRPEKLYGAVDMVKVRDPQNFAAGSLFVAVGVLALYGVTSLRLGTAMRMGPGYAPMLLAWSLIVIGGIIILRSLTVQGEVLSRWAWGPLFLICGGVALFGLLVDYTGLFLASLGAVLVACFGVVGPSWAQRILFALVISACAAFLFVGLLKLPMQLWPW